MLFTSFACLLYVDGGNHCIVDVDVQDVQVVNNVAEDLSGESLRFRASNQLLRVLRFIESHMLGMLLPEISSVQSLAYEMSFIPDGGVGIFWR